MVNLFCDEVWLTSPSPTTNDDHDDHHHHASMQSESYTNSFNTSKEDCEQAFAFYLQKELSYLPKERYMDRLHSYNFIIPRIKVMQWLIKSRSRLNLSHGTLFNAANYLDRFISMNQCHGWKFWMVELLSVACLSVASKFNETSSPTLHEIQMEDLGHSFQSSTIQRMELMLLDALEWHLGPTTAYSYVELLVYWYLDTLKPRLHKELIARVTELLLGTLLDYRFLEFRPWVIALSALRCSFEEFFPLMVDAHMTNISKLVPLHQKDDADLVVCQKIMETRLVNPSYNAITCGRKRHSYYSYCPSSPVTVLLKERIDMYDSQVDLSLFEVQNSSDAINYLKSSKMKRKREEDEEE